MGRPLAEVPLPCRLPVLAGADSRVEIAGFAARMLELPRRFRPFAEDSAA